MGSRQPSGVVNCAAAFGPAERIRFRFLSSAVKRGIPFTAQKLLNYGAPSAVTAPGTTAVTVRVVLDRFARRVEQIHAGAQKYCVSARVIPSNRAVQRNRGSGFSGSYQ